MIVSSIDDMLNQLIYTLISIVVNHLVSPRLPSVSRACLSSGIISVEPDCLSVSHDPTTTLYRVSEQALLSKQYFRCVIGEQLGVDKIMIHVQFSIAFAQ